MRKSLLTSLLALFFVSLSAQEQELLNLKVEARADYQREQHRSHTFDDNTGFKGKFLNLRADGNISDEFSYSYRQRLNKEHEDASFFDATDWVYLTYKKNGWELSAGKQVVAVGGYEYDCAPIDLYFCSEWWHHFPCYQLGVTAGYSFGSHTKLLAQFCESPFRGDKQEEMYAYNLMWLGSCGWFNTNYSVNMLEYLPGKFVNYIVLGHKVNMGDFSLDLDLMNRATSGQTFIGKDITVIGKLSWHPTDKWNVFAKASYDVNNTGSSIDTFVADGTEITRVGGGVEFFPLKDGRNDIRIHATGAYSFGRTTTPDAALCDNQTFLNIGVTWRMNLLSYKK